MSHLFDSPKIALGAFSSDWHLKSYNWASRPEIRGDAFRSAVYIKEWCIKKKLPLYVLGDITDVRHPDAETVGVLMDIISDLEAADVPFLYLQGQHELNRTRPWASCHRHAFWLNKRDINVHGIILYGLDFQPQGELQKCLDEMPDDTDVLLAHQVWRERMGNLRTDEHRPAEGAFADVPHVHMVISGDFHAHKTTKHNGKGGQRMQCMSPGSTYYKTTDEDPKKYFYVLYNDLTFQSVPIPTRAVVRDRVGTDEKLTGIIEKFTGTFKEVKPDDPDKPIWYVEFRPTISNAMERLEQAAKDRAHIFLRPLKEKEPDVIDVDTVSVEEENGDRGSQVMEDFITRVCKSPAVDLTARRLSRAPNVREEVDQIVNEAITEADKVSDEGWNG